jgi:hypothetical protein
MRRQIARREASGLDGPDNRFDLGRPRVVRHRNGDRAQLRDDAVLAGGEQADARARWTSGLA